MSSPSALHRSPDVRPLVQLLETADAEALASMTATSARVAGGWILYGGSGSPVSKVVGLELGPPPSDAELDGIVSWFGERGAEPRVELSAPAPATLLARLASRGFVLRSVEHVLVHGLDPLPEAPPPPGVRLERVDAGDERALRDSIETAMSGFDREDDVGMDALVAFGLGAARRPTADTFVARAGADLVAGASCDTLRGITALYGASVRPAWRGRGLQRALLAARLARARERGGGLATIRSRPGEATERNARRLGFSLAYARVVLARAPQPRAAASAAS